MTNERISLNNPPACVHCEGELPPLEGAGTFYYRFAPNSVTSVRVCSMECGANYVEQVVIGRPLNPYIGRKAVTPAMSEPGRLFCPAEDTLL